MPTPFAITRRVEFADTDMAGIMHFSNFFRFMEVAETDYLTSHGLSVSWVGPDGLRVGFPRVSATCDYARPARFGEVLTVTTTVEKVGRKSVAYRHDFTTKDGAFVAVGRVTAVFCREAGGDYKFESIEIPPDLRAKLEA